MSPSHISKSYKVPWYWYISIHLAVLVVINSTYVLENVRGFFANFSDEPLPQIKLGFKERLS